MSKFDSCFDFYKDIFNKNSFHLYMIGGTSRDFLLGKEITDYDFVTDAEPNDIKKFLIDADFTFEKYGCVRTKFNNINVDITTLREEGEYKDGRHPSFIKFTKDLKIDSKRRDFTINAIYIDENYKIYDFYDGIKDLKNKFIKMIGNPDIRLKEDPLRILRAYRFALLYKMDIDENLRVSMNDNEHLIETLNQDKVQEEISKLTNQL